MIADLAECSLSTVHRALVRHEIPARKSWEKAQTVPVQEIDWRAYVLRWLKRVLRHQKTIKRRQRRG